MFTLKTDRRKAGIPSGGALPWGSTFCQFYRTKKDLLDILLPFLIAGLENNEFCVWVTSDVLGEKDAIKALKKSVPGFASCMAEGRMEVVPFNRWKARGGKSGKAILSRLDKAIAGGFEGLRLACVADRAAGGMKEFVTCGTDAVRGNKVIAAFAYPRNSFDALGLMEAVKKHRFALLRNPGGWEVIENREARSVKDDLKRSEEKLKSLFGNMSEGFAYHRVVQNDGRKPADYIFLEVNKAFEKLTGLDAKNLLGKRATAFLPKIEEDPSRWIEKFCRVALTGKPVRFENYSAPLKRWFAVSAFSPHKGYFAVTLSDITERKRTEDALRRAKEDWELTFDNVPDMIALLDCKHRIVRVNKAMADKLKTSAEKCVGKFCYEVVHGTVGPPTACPHLLTCMDGREHLAELHEPNLGADLLVSTTPIKGEDGSVIGSVHVARDITERKKTEEAIRCRNLVLDGIGRILGLALTTATEEELGRACLAVAEEVTGSRFGFIVEIGKDGLLNDLAISDPGWEDCAMTDKAGHRRPPGYLKTRGLHGRVLLDGKGLFTNRPAGHTDSIGTPDGHPPLTAFLGVPLIHGGSTIGMVGVGNRAGGYRPEDLDALSALSGAIVQAVMRKRAEEALNSSLAEKEILLKELAHRTKNNMQVVANLIGLQASTTSDRNLLDAFADTQDRIRAMALVHEKLYRSGNVSFLDMKEYVPDLLAFLLHSHQGAAGPVRSELDLEYLTLPIDAAIPCGLIINELVSNSLKHAFKDRKAGTIFLSLKRRGGIVELKYRDDGPGLPRDLEISRANTLGLRLIHNLAVRQLRGKMDLRRDPVTEFAFMFDSFAHLEKT
jgi:PAS domain S-box-containing protein